MSEGDHARVERYEVKRLGGSGEKMMSTSRWKTSRSSERTWGRQAGSRQGTPT